METGKLQNKIVQHCVCINYVCILLCFLLCLGHREASLYVFCCALAIEKHLSHHVWPGLAGFDLQMQHLCTPLVALAVALGLEVGIFAPPIPFKKINIKIHALLLKAQTWMLFPILLCTRSAAKIKHTCSFFPFRKLATWIYTGPKGICLYWLSIWVCSCLYSHIQVSWTSTTAWWFLPHCQHIIKLEC